jgi:hypothetical protein
MKAVTISEFKAHLKRKILRILPFLERKPKKKKLGLLEGKGEFIIAKDFEITTEEFLGLWK